MIVRSDFKLTEWLQHWATEFAEGYPLTDGARPLLVEDLTVAVQELKKLEHANRELASALEQQGERVVLTPQGEPTIPREDIRRAVNTVVGRHEVTTAEEGP